MGNENKQFKTLINSSTSEGKNNVQVVVKRQRTELQSKKEQQLQVTVSRSNQRV